MATIHGTNGNDRADLGGTDLIGTSGNDHIYGYGGEDLLDGRDGHDVLDVGSGSYNTARGGAGDDVILSDGRGWFDGGAGQDMMMFRSGASGSFNLGEGWGAYGPAATDRFTMMNFESIATGAGNDTITGSELRNVITAGAGADVVLALGGNDVVYGGLGNDALDGGAGDDDLRGDVGDDQLNGGAGADILDGGDGRDLLWGGSGDDLLKGGRGNDTLDGGESGYDTASYASHLAAVTVDLTQSKAWSSVNGVSEVDSLFRVEKVVGSSYDDFLFAGTTTAIDGGSGRDTVYSGSGGNVMTGGSGVDTLSYQFSTAGVTVSLRQNTAEGGWATGDQISYFENLRGSGYADTLSAARSGSGIDGREGNDTLRGHDGQDLLIGGAGIDSLWGGNGRDTLRFESFSDSPWPASDHDVILDFQKGFDKIDLSAIDANTATAADNAFSKMISSSAAYMRTDFTAGTINVRHQGGDTWVDLNVTQSSSTYGQPHYDPMEMSFKLEGYHSLTLDDFIL